MKPVLSNFFDRGSGLTLFRVSWKTSTGSHTQTYGTLSEASAKVRQLENTK
jgi:hypothetical protein